MNSAFNHHAGRKAGRLARCAALACALVLGAGGAYAQQHGDRGDRGGDPAMQGIPVMQGQGQGQQRPERFRLPQGDPRQGDGRGADDGRRAQQQQDQGDARRGSRMTPDERRDLRRQINEAGMDLYPQRRHDR
jgi:hypothetical protein